MSEIRVTHMALSVAFPMLARRASSLAMPDGLEPAEPAVVYVTPALLEQVLRSAQAELGLLEFTIYLSPLVLGQVERMHYARIVFVRDAPLLASPALPLWACSVASPHGNEAMLFDLRTGKEIAND